MSLLNPRILSKVTEIVYNINMKNVTLYESLKTYCNAAIEYLNTVPHSDVQDWKKFILQHDIELLKLPSAQKAMENLREDQVIAPQLNTLLGSSGHERNIQAAGVLRNVLLDVVEKEQNLRISENTFRVVFEEMENFFHTVTFTLCFQAPLLKFTSTEKVIQLERNLKIKALNETEASELNRLLGKLPPKTVESTDGVYTFCVLEYLLEVPKVVGPQPVSQLKDMPEKKAFKIFLSVQKALREFKPAGVGFGDIAVTRQGWQLADSSYCFHVKNLSSNGPQYLLNGDEAKEFVKMWESYSK